VPDVAYAFGELCRCVLVQLHDSRNLILTQSPEDMRRNQYLITNDVERYMAEYEVRYIPPFFTCQQELRLSQASGDPDVIGRLVLLLADWYFAWAPGGEYVSLIRT
jgi:hypothetical protein